MYKFLVFGRGELAIFALKYLNSKNVLMGFVPDLPEPKWQDSVVDYCNENSIKIFDFKNIENLIEPNVIGVSIYFRKIFRQELISKFVYFVNLHNGPLPKYRGVNPVNWALKNNEREHGVTLHDIDQGIDTGDILDQEIFDIHNDMEVVDVYRLCIDSGKKIIERSILKIHTLPRTAQDNSLATYYSAKDFEKLGDRKDFRRK